MTRLDGIPDPLRDGFGSGDLFRLGRQGVYLDRGLPGLGDDAPFQEHFPHTKLLGQGPDQCGVEKHLRGRFLDPGLRPPRPAGLEVDDPQFVPGQDHQVDAAQQVWAGALCRSRDSLNVCT